MTIDNTFGDQTDVFRIGNKMFALLNSDARTLTVKTAPSESVALQEKYSSVKPGYYMNKTHWITIDLNGNVPASVARELIDNAYTLVFESLTKKQKAAIALSRTSPAVE